MTTNCLNKNGDVKKLKNIMLYTTIMVVIFLNTIVVSAGIATTYAVYIDPGLGFYKVRDITTPSSNFSYEHRTLEINQGDTIEWINDADDKALTIVSDQDLFAPITIGIGKHTDYLFEQSGAFQFHIQEYPDVDQTIIVALPKGSAPPISINKTPFPTNTTTVAPTEIITPAPTENITTTENITPSPNSTENLNKNNSDPKIGNLKLSNAAIPSIIVSIMSIFMFLIGRKG